MKWSKAAGPFKAQSAHEIVYDADVWRQAYHDTNQWRWSVSADDRTLVEGHFAGSASKARKLAEATVRMLKKHRGRQQKPASGRR